MINRYKITEFLANNKLSDYLTLANDVGNREFVLKFKEQLGELAVFVAEQSGLATKAKIKLPAFSKANCIYTPRSLEQCTNESVAEYKASKIGGEILLTLAAGLGADDFALSKRFKRVVSVDNDPILNQIATHNFRSLGILNIERVTSDAETFIQTTKDKFDAIYIDPDRRTDNERQILLSEHRPDVISLMPLLLETAKHVWIKCSPLYDIDMALKEIGTISEIYCISLKGEVKEMLLYVEDHITKTPALICTDIGSEKITEFRFSGENMVPALTDEIKGYLFEAGATLVKTRKHHTYASINNMELIDAKVPFYITGTLKNNMLGKYRLIKHVAPFNPKQIKLYLKNHHIRQINIKARGVNIDTVGLFKKLVVKEGGDDFLFLCPYKQKNIVIHCGAL